MHMDYTNTFYSSINMRKIYQRIINEYKSEYYENRNSNFSDFDDFADWYINKIISDDILDKYEDFTGTMCLSKYEEDDILDNVLNYVCNNVDGDRIEASIDEESYNIYDYDSRAFF